jgi:hypothetical protein
MYEPLELAAGYGTSGYPRTETIGFAGFIGFPIEYVEIAPPASPRLAPARTRGTRAVPGGLPPTSACGLQGAAAPVPGPPTFTHAVLSRW